MVEKSGNGKIAGGDFLKGVDYSDWLTLMEGAKPSSILLLDINGLLQTIPPVWSNLTNGIKSTAVNPQKYGEFVFTFGKHSCGCHFQFSEPEKESAFSQVTVFKHC